MKLPEVVCMWFDREQRHRESEMAIIITADTLDQADPIVWGKVRSAFAEALGLDDEEVALHNTIVDDLGAESLDFLDIAFRLERSFDIRIPRGGIETAARGELDDEVYEQAGVLTAKALEGLRDAMPEIPASEFRDGLRTTEVPELFRVATFYNLVVRLQKQQAEEGGNAA